MLHMLQVQPLGVRQKHAYARPQPERYIQVPYMHSGKRQYSSQQNRGKTQMVYHHSKHEHNRSSKTHEHVCNRLPTFHEEISPLENKNHKKELRHITDILTKNTEIPYRYATNHQIKNDTQEQSQWG